MYLNPLIIIPLVILVLLALGLLYVGIRGVAELTHPHCARCRYDLRGSGNVIASVCSECGADLKQTGSIWWGGRRGRPRMVWAGCVVLVLILLLLAGTPLILQMASGDAAELVDSNFKSNEQIVASITGSGDRQSDWDEMTRRVAAGKFNSAEIATAVEQFSIMLEGARQNDSQKHALLLRESEDFFRAADTKIRSEQWIRLINAHLGAPRITISARVRAGHPIPFRVIWGSEWQLDVCDFVCALREFKTKEQTPLKPVATYDFDARSSTRRKKPDPNLLSISETWREITGDLSGNLSAGEHEVTFFIDAAVLKEGASPSAAMGRPGQSSSWPSAKAGWSVPVSVKVKVLPPDQSPIELIQATVQSPAPRITAPNASATKTAKGLRLGVAVHAHRDMPCSFDAFARIEGIEHALGRYILSPDAKSDATTLALEMKSLPQDVRHLDLILRPNPSYAEEIAGMNRIWGGELEIPAVPITRWDLEAADSLPAAAEQ